MNQQQRTVAEKVSCTGVGLHTGIQLELSIHPARTNSGIVFVRRDGPVPVEIPARPSTVHSTVHATTLASPVDSSIRVTTVEHVLAALYATGIDNVRIEINGPEVPALDGSAAGFVDLVRSAGIFLQNEPRAVLRVLRPVEVRDGDRAIRVEPSPRLRVSYAVDFDHPVIARQELDLPRVDERFFVRELARARTFGFLHEVSALLRAGLARGGSLENTVVLDEEVVLNAEGLRWPDEFVRHKIVDLLGDLALLGLPIQGHVSVERGGHALHQMLIQELIRDADAWTILRRGAEVPSGLELAPWMTAPPTPPAS
ncbi:MAG: UDP-3-O-acyl-N-acetylglucosamine deacetylase [Myxococcota bacterium]